MDEVKRRRRRKGFTRVSSKNQVTLPIDVLLAAGVRAGDSLMVETKTTGEIVLRREEDPLERYYGSMTGAFPPNYLRDLRVEWE
jgi:bifunctional DNA-binding transcriptional regulator/antitoxin component of YhaV-PrlF toxin-antitoxin module